MNAKNLKCGDCAMFQKSHKTITSEGWYKSICSFGEPVPEYIPDEQRPKYIAEYIKLRAKDEKCDNFIEYINEENNTMPTL